MQDLPQSRAWLAVNPPVFGMALPPVLQPQWFHYSLDMCEGSFVTTSCIDGHLASEVDNPPSAGSAHNVLSVDSWSQYIAVRSAVWVWLAEHLDCFYILQIEWAALHNAEIAPSF